MRGPLTHEACVIVSSTRDDNRKQSGINDNGRDEPGHCDVTYSASVDQLLLKTGLRFSTKARTASLWFSVNESLPMRSASRSIAVR